MYKDDDVENTSNKKSKDRLIKNNESSNKLI